MPKIKVTSKNLEKAIKRNSKISKKRKAQQRKKEKYAINKAMKSQGIKPKKDTDKIILAIFIIIVVVVTLVFYIFEPHTLIFVNSTNAVINHVLKAVAVVQRYSR